MTSPPIPRSTESLSRLNEFVLHEAELADEHRYGEWLALWSEQDALYYVPYDGSDRPTTQVAVIRDDYQRLCERINRLKGGQTHTQNPPSQLCRVLGQPTYQPAETPDCHVVRAGFVCVEVRPERQFTWAGKVTYLLRETGPDEIRLQQKIVHLVNVVQPMPALSFII